MSSLLDVAVRSLKAGESGGSIPTTCLRAVSADKCRGKMVVVDIWHTQCQRCPAALSKLSDLAGKLDIAAKAVFFSIALTRGQGNFEVARDLAGESEDDWGNVSHFFAEDVEKETIKAMFGITQVPYVIIVNADGTVNTHGDPKSIDIMNILNSASTDTTAIAVASTAPANTAIDAPSASISSSLSFDDDF